MFQTKVVEEIVIHILCSVAFFFFRKSCRLWNNVENIVEPGRPQMTIWRIRIACWIPKATHTHTHTHKICNTYWLLHCNNGCKNAPHCYVCMHIAVLLRYVIVSSTVNTFVNSVWSSYKLRWNARTRGHRRGLQSDCPSMRWLHPFP